jgi:hypothetical protein
MTTKLYKWLGVLAISTAAAQQTNGYALRQAGTPAGAPAVLQFDRTLLLETTSEDSANVSMGDLNGDGNLDIVLAKGRHTPLVNRVLINDGRGRFPVAQDLGSADRSYSAGLVDLDADGDLDIVVSNDKPDPKPVYLNDGRANFRLGSTYGRPEWPMRNASVADLNGDGLPDIIAANRTGDSNGSNYVCLNRGKGQFDADCLAFSHESTTTITPADINRDGFIDLVVPHREGGQSYVYLNDGKAGFPKRVPFGPSKTAIRVAEGADLNDDGFVDIVAIDGLQGPAIYLNEQGRAFAAGFSPSSNIAEPYALAVGDVNADGKIDIVVGNLVARPVVYFNHGSGRNFTPVRFGQQGFTAYGFAIGDLDKDGHRDIALARTGAPNMVYFGGIASKQTPPVEPSPGPGLISSFDGDSITSSFGRGWRPVSDENQGGRSTSNIKPVSGGALRSTGLLHVEGEIASGANPWAGVAFDPGPEYGWTADFSKVTRVSFWAKGDGRTYKVNLASGLPRVERDVTFVAGPDWREYTFDLSVLASDKQKVFWLSIWTGPEQGHFEFQLDEVRLQ